MSARNRSRANKPKHRRRVGAAVHQSQHRLLEQQAHDAYLEDDDPERARELFQQAEALGPLSDSGLDTYLDVLQTLGDLDHYARIALTMVDRHPGDPKANMLAGSACYATMQPVSAILYWEKVSQLEPKHPATASVREELTKLRKHLPEILSAFVDDLPKELPRVASVENILHFLKLGRFGEVIRRCRKHLQCYPDDVRIRNNLAEALSLRGDLAESLEVLNETIQRVPNNFYARAARCRVLHFLNRKADSDADALELRSLVPKQVSDLTKAAQTFAFVGQEDGIAWAYDLAVKNDWLKEDSPDVALLLHYEATRLARANDLQTAKTLWKRADKIAGKSIPAGENLNDLRRPVGERNGPSYFEFRDWLSASQQVQLRSVVGAVRAEENMSKALSDHLRSFLQQNGELEHLLPDMLERGDQATVRLAAKMARSSSSNEVKAALRDFVQNPRGADSLRAELAGDLHRDGVLDSDTVEIYVRGKKDRIEFIDFEITEEPTTLSSRDEDFQARIELAIQYLHDGEGAKAEALFRQALSVEPDAPDIKNNLAMSLEMQGRTGEADRLIDEVIVKHPHYFFGQIALANRAIKRHDFDAALQTLVQLQRRKQLHWTEFLALARSMVYTFVGKRDFPSAERWLGMLEDYSPEHPAVEQLRKYIQFNRSVTPSLSRLLGNRTTAPK